MHEAKWKKPQHICIMNTLNCQLVLLYVVFLLPREWAERELHFARRNILISLKQLFSLYHNNFEVELLSCYPPWNISRTLFSNRFPLVHVFCAWTTSYFSHMMLLPPRVNWGPWTSEMEPVNGECRQSIQWTDPDTRTSARAANTLLLDTQNGTTGVPPAILTHSNNLFHQLEKATPYLWHTWRHWFLQNHYCWISVWW